VRDLSKRAQERFSLDRHVVSTLLLRLWALAAGAITVLLIPLCLSPVEQGYYFTFASILALQIFFDLGLSQVLVQFVARNMNELHSGHGQLRGHGPTLAKLAALRSSIRRAFSFIALGFFVLVGIAGAIFFSKYDQRAASHELWLPAWALMVLFTAGNLYNAPQLAMAEGAGQIGDVAQMRTQASVLGYGLAWLLLLSGAGLLSMPVIAAANFVTAKRWIQRRSLLTSLPGAPREAHTGATQMDWRKDIFPFQWRMALSWISGYMIFQLFNPVIFANHGPEVAGQVGLAMALFNALITLSMSWISASAPSFAKLIAANSQASLRALFKAKLLASATVNFILCGTLVAAAWLAQLHALPLAHRLPTHSILVCLMLISLSNHMVFAMAVYMRAHGQEPLLAPSIVTGLATAAILFTVTKYSLQGAMWGYASVQVLICLPWVTFIFRRHYWRNHIRA
jgi:hypothetical protein